MPESMLLPQCSLPKQNICLGSLLSIIELNTYLMLSSENSLVKRIGAKYKWKLLNGKLGVLKLNKSIY